MKILDKSQILQALAKALHRPCMMIILNQEDDTLPYDINKQGCLKAAPYINATKHYQVLSDEEAFIVFHSHKAMMNAFKRTIGDKGATKENIYSGNDVIYAETCDENGFLESTNK